MSQALEQRSAALAQLTVAQRALVQASNVFETKEVLDRAKAVRAYAEASNLGESVNRAAGIFVIRAQRKLGAFLAEAVKPGNPQLSPGATNELPLGITRSQSSRWQQVADVPDQVFKDFIGSAKAVTVARLLRVAREHEADQRRAEPVAPIATIGQAEIRHGDLRTVLADASADAIITDPPYSREHLDEFDALGELAAAILKPDGVMVVMVGQTHLPDYIERLTRHVTYRWCGAYLTEGPATRIHGRKVGTKWKPILIFGGTRFLTQDVFASQGDDKGHHHWGQSESGMADLVERLTEPGELVVDPFLGGGTTALVCRDLGRRFIGCDVDANAIQATTERLAA